MIGNKRWVRNTEYAMFDAFDKNYFASQFHIGLFAQEMFNDPEQQSYLQSKIVRTGWPFEYLGNTIQNDTIGVEKDNLILFPHRNAPEKQLKIFEDLALQLPEYDFINCADYDLKKQDYHKPVSYTHLTLPTNSLV